MACVRAINLKVKFLYLLGVQGLQVEELWSLDEESFEQLRLV